MFLAYAFLYKLNTISTLIEMSPVWLVAAQEYLSSVALFTMSSWRLCCPSSRSPSNRISSAGCEQLEHQSGG